MDRIPWDELAACRGMNPDLFAPEGVTEVDLDALAVCARCPVTTECHEAAHAGDYAMWTIHGGELPHHWSFKGARVGACTHCGRPKVVGGRATRDEVFCDNHCRYRHRYEAQRRAAGEVALFDDDLGVPA